MAGKTILRLVALVLLIAAVCGLCFAVFGSLHFTRTASEIQPMIDAKLPYTWKNQITVTKVGVDLGGNKVYVNIDATTTKFGKELAVTVRAAGYVRYDAEQGAFYVDVEDLTLTDFEHDGIRFGSKWGPRFQKLSELLPHRLQDRERQAVQRAKDFAKDELVHVAQGLLKTVPIYHFTDDLKGQVKHMVVSDVNVHDSALHVHVTFFKLTTFAFGMVGLTVIAVILMIAVATNPGAFAILELFSMFG